MFIKDFMIKMQNAQHRQQQALNNSERARKREREKRMHGVEDTL